MIRAKTRNRLVLLIIVGFTGTLALGGAWAIRRTYLRSQARHAGEVGIAEAKSGDYASALPNLARCLGRFPQDADALYYYALSRQHVPEPDDAQLGQAIVLWRRLIDVRPDNIDARHQLLDLYVQVGFNPEMIDSAAALLQRIPDDPAALHAKAIALYRQRKFSDAAATITHLNQLHPDDFDNQLLALSIESANGTSPQDLVKQAKALHQSHPDDVHFALLESIALANAGDRSAAADAIRNVIAKPVADAPTLTLLLNQLDSLQLFDESLAAAQSAAKQHAGAPEYQRLLATRLLVGTEYPQVDALLKSLSADDASTDSQLLVLKGISLAFEGNQKDAAALFTAVSKRPQSAANTRAAAMANAALASIGDAADAKAHVQTCKEALQADPKNPFLHFFLAQSYAQQQNIDFALNEWQAAVTSAPAWGLPLARCAQALLRAERAPDAYAFAQAARTRAPNDRGILAVLASAWSASININQADQVAKLQALLEDIQQRFPDSQDTRPLLINLLAHTNQSAEALKQFHAALDASPPPSEATLLQLATVSRINHLNLEDACFAQCEKLHGMSAALAFAKAAWLAGTGKPKDGLALFEAAMPQKTADANWRLAYARFLEMTSDPRAKANWLALADAFPTNTNIQWSTLTAPSVQDDHDFQGRIISRLRDQLGPNNMEGRLAQALWLLRGQPTDKQVSEASVILSDLTRSAPDLTQPRILLAGCLQKLGNFTAAVEQLRLAVQASPDDNSVRLRLASLLITQGESADARLQLEKVAQTANSAAEREQTASLYFSLGDRDRAAQLLQSDTDANSRLMLADFYLQQNDPAKAEAIARDLMQKPSAAIIGLYASTLAAQNRPAEAQGALDKLDAVDISPAARALTRAQYFDRIGKSDDAFAQYLAATAASPKDASTWRQLLLFCLRTNRTSDLPKYLASALQAAPADPGFSAINDNLANLKTVAGDATDRTLFVALLSDSSNIPALLQAIHLATSTAPATQTLAQVRQLADANPRILPIQLFAAHYCALLHQNDDAVTLSARAEQAFPNSPQAAQLSTECLAAAGKWKEALAAAQRWRKLTPAQPLDADTAIAAAASQLGNPSAGLSQITPYLDRALKSPNDYPRIILLYIQDLLATNQMDRAANVLHPLLDTPQWRLAWLKFAETLPDAAARADWINRVAPSIPTDKPAEQLQLAVEYNLLAQVSKNPAYQEKSKAIIDPLLKRPDLDPALALVIGSLYESQKNPQAAEEAYRLVLAKDPKEPIALNNLAMLLIYANQRNKEAVDLEDRAIKAAPDVPGLYDSKAIILGLQQHFPEALDTITQALNRDPSNPNWKATQIWLLASSGKRDAAAAEFKQLHDTPIASLISENSKKRLSSIGFE